MSPFARGLLPGTVQENLRAGARPRHQRTEARTLDGIASGAYPHVQSFFRGDTMFRHRIAQTHRPANRSAALRLEVLEDRCCPDCTVLVTGSTLRIIGDAAKN